MRSSITLWLALVLLPGTGCEDSGPSPGAGATSRAEMPASGTAAPAAPGGAEGAADKALKEGQQRKIIFTGNVEVTVEDFSKAERGVAALVATHGGYLAESSVSGSPGEPRSGRWKARVPVDRFDAFVDGVAALGDLRERRTSSTDVSDEYFDLEARIKNKAAEEARLIRHLEVSTGKLEEILQVERELSRVREEVERMQGRKQVLANLTSLTTVSITIQERVGYVPPESPTFRTRLAHTFRNSLDNLIGFGQSLALMAAAVLPWLPVIVPLGFVLWLLARNSLRAWRAAIDRENRSMTVPR